MSFHRWLSLLLTLKIIASVQYLLYYLSGTGMTCSMLACRLLGILVCINRCKDASTYNFIKVSIYQSFHMFLVHNDLSSAISIHRLSCFVCMTPIYGLLTLNRSLFRLFVSWLFGVILQYNSGSMTATLSKSPFQNIYFSLWYRVFTSFQIRAAIF